MNKNVKSPKEISLEKKLLAEIDPKRPAYKITQLLINDAEIEAIQDYANTVSIVRLGFNDHGPVHMRQVARNAIKMMYLLKEAGIEGSLANDKVGTFDDSLSAVVLASFLHDLGMAIGRQDHELFSATMASTIIDRLLLEVYPTDIKKRVIIKALALEGIVGHMATRKIHSIEAGVILVADGCDMEKGRARIPIALSTEAKIGDIHKYSASSIESVLITKGENLPIRIEVEMSSEVGFFQVEEVLFPKINSSPIKQYVELFAHVVNESRKQYL
jgi:metal-dependent HD superfamily phosphatase/phosphodiesterase